MLEQLVCLIRRAGCAGLVLCCSLVTAPLAQAQDAAALRARHVALHEQLAASPFGRALILESSELPSGLKGEIHAQIDMPYPALGQALQISEHWCDILLLHLNVKHCAAHDSPRGSTLALDVGSKYDQPLANAYHFHFVYRVVVARPDYLQVQLSAEQGPLGTSNYRIVLEVVALDAGRSFLHLSYAYQQGVVARMAMQGYLATIGRDKVGFSIVGRAADGRPRYIGGLRGVVERNTMRYFLAIESFLGALALPAAQRSERRLVDWFAGVERYPVQLHELELDEYLGLKREQLRGRAARPAAGARGVPAAAL